MDCSDCCNCSTEIKLKDDVLSEAELENMMCTCEQKPSSSFDVKVEPFFEYESNQVIDPLLTSDINHQDHVEQPNNLIEEPDFNVSNNRQTNTAQSQVFVNNCHNYDIESKVKKENTFHPMDICDIKTEDDTDREQYGSPEVSNYIQEQWNLEYTQGMIYEIDIEIDIMS